jgi:hypothetical protein
MNEIGKKLKDENNRVTIESHFPLLPKVVCVSKF